MRKNKRSKPARSNRSKPSKTKVDVLAELKKVDEARLRTASGGREAESDAEFRCFCY